MTTRITPLGSSFTFVAADDRGNTVSANQGGGLLATGATGGFLYVPGMTGAPASATGPTGYTGTVAHVFDVSNNMPWFLNSVNTFGGSTGARPSWVAGNGQVLIQQLVLGSATNTVTISNIPQIFNHLRLITTVRADGAYTSNFVNLQFNGDTGTNYHGEVAYAFNSAFASNGIFVNRTYTEQLGYVSGTTAPANFPGMNVFDIPHYNNTTFFKTVRNNGAICTSTSGQNGTIFSAYSWASTAAITSVTILLAPGVGNFVAGSIFSLYGIW